MAALLSDREQLKDRAMGALLGAFIGDALGVGPHWYYDLDELHKDYGEWISDYTDPKPGRYHEDLKAGDNSQCAFILKLALKNLVDTNGEYSEVSFCEMLEKELFPLIDGTPMNGPGGYTSQSIRDVYKMRVELDLPWGEIGGNCDDTEAAERVIAFAVRYALQPAKLAEVVKGNTLLTQTDGVVVAMTLAFAAVLGMLVEGHSLDANISSKLMTRVKDKVLPFYFVTSGNLEAPKKGQAPPKTAGLISSPDALLTSGTIAQAAKDPAIRIDPAWKASLVYGLPCAIFHVLPSVYYLSARFNDDFEAAVLHAVNGGGQNLSRAMLTGALVGAQVGLSRIPKKFFERLSDAAELLVLCEQVADLLLTTTQSLS